jgi:hypothetical protein
MALISSISGTLSKSQIPEFRYSFRFTPSLNPSRSSPFTSIFANYLPVPHGDLIFDL